MQTLMISVEVMVPRELSDGMGRKLVFLAIASQKLRSDPMADSFLQVCSGRQSVQPN